MTIDFNNSNLGLRISQYSILFSFHPIIVRSDAKPIPLVIAMSDKGAKKQSRKMAFVKYSVFKVQRLVRLPRKSRSSIMLAISEQEKVNTTSPLTPQSPQR